MRDNARTESVEEIRTSSVKQQPTSPSTHEYARAMLTARSYSLGRAGGTASVWLATFKPMSCLFSPVVLEVALHRRHRATLAAGATKSEAAGADGNRGTAVPPFPKRYDYYGIENKNNGRTSGR